jgi:hypothetical protein
MSISYSGLTTYGKVTLPSVEGWGTSLNIVKDPPKSIHTRRINKVGETSMITEDIDAARDRACEAIRVYARGTNPAVSVMYTNQGMAGGSCKGEGSSANTTNSGLCSNTQASLPYKIMKDGAFRPPVFTQEQLLPLSRQPRAKTCANTIPNLADYTKRILACGNADQTKETRSTIITYAASSGVAKRRTATLDEAQSYDIKYNIQNPLQASVRTNEVNARVHSTPCPKLEVGRYTKVSMNTSANTKKSRTSVWKAPVQNTMKNRSRSKPIGSYQGVVPNRGVEIKNYNASLKPTLSIGGMEANPSMPVNHAN